MRRRHASFTARFVAASRGLAPLLPRGLRLVDDPYGAALAAPVLGALITAAARAPSLVRGLLWAPLLPMFPWAVYMQVRTRFFDDALGAFVREGGRQVVILGAGFDARAARLGVLGDARVFEVDHPATQAVKRRALAPSRVTWLAWDFEHDKTVELPARLASAGHDPSRPTFTLWEGVTMYLSHEALDATLDAVRAYSAAGSMLAFNYVDRGFIERAGLATGALRGVVRVLGEPFLTGFEPPEAAAWVARHGFVMHDDQSFPEVAKTLLPASWWRLVRMGRRVAIAERSAIARSTVIP